MIISICVWSDLHFIGNYQYSKVLLFLSIFKWQKDLYITLDFYRKGTPRLLIIKHKKITHSAELTYKNVD